MSLGKKKGLNLEQGQKSVLLFFCFQDQVGEILFFSLKSLSVNIDNNVFKNNLFAEPIS